MKRCIYCGYHNEDNDSICRICRSSRFETIESNIYRRNIRQNHTNQYQIFEPCSLTVIEFEKESQLLFSKPETGVDYFPQKIELDGDLLKTINERIYSHIVREKETLHHLLCPCCGSILEVEEFIFKKAEMARRCQQSKIKLYRSLIKTFYESSDSHIQQEEETIYQLWCPYCSFVFESKEMRIGFWEHKYKFDVSFSGQQIFPVGEYYLDLYRNIDDSIELAQKSLIIYGKELAQAMKGELKVLDDHCFILKFSNEGLLIVGAVSLVFPMFRRK